MPNPSDSPVSRPDVEGIAARMDAARKNLDGWGPRPMAINVLSPLVNDIPALIAHIEALEARMEKLEVVVKAAGELRKPLYNFFGFGFDIYLHDDKTWDGDCTPEQARGEYEKCDLVQSKLKKALAALGDGDG